MMATTVAGIGCNYISCNVLLTTHGKCMQCLLTLTTILEMVSLHDKAYSGVPIQLEQSGDTALLIAV